MDDKKDFNPGMQGEGNKRADKQYRDAAADFAKSGKVEQGAKDAERHVDDADLEAAVEEGKRHSKGDLEKDLRGGAKPDAEMKKP